MCMNVSNNMTSVIYNTLLIITLSYVNLGCNNTNSKVYSHKKENLPFIEKKIDNNADSLTLLEPKITCVNTKEIKAIKNLHLKANLIKISKFPEVKDLDKNETTFCCHEFKRDNKTYYAIRVLLEKETHFSGKFSFYVDVENSDNIFIEDFITNKWMTLKEYRSTYK